MALTPIALTEAELFMAIDQTATKFTDLAGQMKVYVDAKRTSTEDTLRAEMAANKQELEDNLQIDMDALAAFKVIVDKFDGAEDGEFNTAEKLLEIQTDLIAAGNRITVTETDIATVNTALQAEVAARTSEDTRLETLINEVKQDGADMLSSFETSIAGVIARLDAIEAELNKVGSHLVAGFNRLSTKLNESFDNAKLAFAIPAP